MCSLWNNCDLPIFEHFGGWGFLGWGGNGECVWDWKPVLGFWVFWVFEFLGFGFLGFDWFIVGMTMKTVDGTQNLSQQLVNQKRGFEFLRSIWLDLGIFLVFRMGTHVRCLLWKYIIFLPFMRIGDIYRSVSYSVTD